MILKNYFSLFYHNMSEADKKLQERLVKSLQSRFNELADELQLSDDEKSTFDTSTESGLEAGINVLRIERGRKNAWNEAFPKTKEKGFFHPADKRANAGQPTGQKPSEQPPAPVQKRFNMMQLADARYADDDPDELEGTNNKILRVYAYRGADGLMRMNESGFKV